jgi:hypothetical protein
VATNETRMLSVLRPRKRADRLCPRVPALPVWAAVAFTSLAIYASIAAAVAVTPGAWIVGNAETPIPANGVVLLHYLPGTFATAPVDEGFPELLDLRGVPIASTVERLSVSAPHKRVMRPAAPLEPGTTYSVEPVQYFAVELNAGAPVTTFEPPRLSATLLGTPTPGTRAVQRCCELDSAATGNCLRVMQAQVPTLTIKTPIADDDSIARQFVYRALLTNPGERTPLESWLSASEIRYGWSLLAARPAEQYCYRIEAYRLTDGPRFTLVAACASRSLELTYATDEEIRAALDIDGCALPPGELTQAWCEVNRATCATSSAACEAASYSATCAAFPPFGASLSELVASAPPPPAEIDPAPPTPDDLTEDSSEPEGEAARPRSGGCSATPLAHGAAPWAFALVLLLKRATAARSRRRPPFA